MLGTELRIKRINFGISQSKLAGYTNIPQALLSAFELGKQDIKSIYIDSINNFLSLVEEGKIEQTKKRYQKHIRDGKLISNRPRRKYEKTDKNKKYLDLLSDLESNFQSHKSNGLKAMSFFAGCGGLCYGVKAAGFDIVATNELEESYKNIYNLNFTEANFLPNDITTIKKKDISRILEKYGNIDLLLGGPPCQGFSLAGKRDIHDDRNTLFQYYLDIANIIKPKVILIENVKLLTTMKDSDGTLVSDRILDTFKKYGYQCSYFYLNAKDYGVPQSRERVFFIAVREDISIPPSVPMPTHNKSNYFTFGDAVSDLEYIESGETSTSDKLHKSVKHPDHVLKWLIDVPEGKSAHDNEIESLRPPSGYNTTYKRQIWNEPGKTVGTTFAMISGSNNVHPIATRSITTREALRLQSFPDSFKVIGKHGNIRTTIGNAVPPLLAYVLVNHIKDTYIL